MALCTHSLFMRKIRTMLRKNTKKLDTGIGNLNPKSYLQSHKLWPLRQNSRGKTRPPISALLFLLIFSCSEKIFQKKKWDNSSHWISIWKCWNKFCYQICLNLYYEIFSESLVVYEKTHCVKRRGFFLRESRFQNKPSVMQNQNHNSWLEIVKPF